MAASSIKAKPNTHTQAGPTDEEHPQDAAFEDIVRQIVLPAANLEVMISHHLEEEGARLDTTTRLLLAAARDRLHSIARHGAVVASSSVRS